MTGREDWSIAIRQALLVCAVCDHPYTSRVHIERCVMPSEEPVCVCPPGPHLPDCVEVVGEAA